MWTVFHIIKPMSYVNTLYIRYWWWGWATETFFSDFAHQQKQDLHNNLIWCTVFHKDGCTWHCACVRPCEGDWGVLQHSCPSYVRAAPLFPLAHRRGVHRGGTGHLSSPRLSLLPINTACHNLNSGWRLKIRATTMHWKTESLQSLGVKRRFVITAYRHMHLESYVSTTWRMLQMHMIWRHSAGFSYWLTASCVTDIEAYLGCTKSFIIHPAKSF